MPSCRTIVSITVEADPPAYSGAAAVEPAGWGAPDASAAGGTLRSDAAHTLKMVT